MSRLTQSYGVLLALALTTGPAMAQSSYYTGYSDGYNDSFPAGATPDSNTAFGRGFQAGQDDRNSDDDQDDAMLRQERERTDAATRAEQQHQELDRPLDLLHEPLGWRP